MIPPQPSAGWKASSLLPFPAGLMTRSHSDRVSLPPWPLIRNLEAFVSLTTTIIYAYLAPEQVHFLCVCMCMCVLGYLLDRCLAAQVANNVMDRLSPAQECREEECMRQPGHAVTTSFFDSSHSNFSYYSFSLSFFNYFSLPTPIVQCSPISSISPFHIPFWLIPDILGCPLLCKLLF